MKSLRKNDIESMERELQVLENPEGILGGTFYYDKDGKLLGQVGSGAEVRVTTADMFIDCQNYKNEDAGSLFTASESKAKEAILRNMFPSGVEFRNVEEDSSETGTLSAVIHFGHKDGSGNIIVDGADFKFNGSDPKWNNFYNMKSSVTHESYHYSHPVLESAPIEDKGAYENLAVLTQVNDESMFKNTTQDYRQGIANDLYKAWKAMGIADKDGKLTQADANAKCLVNK